MTSTSRLVLQGRRVRLRCSRSSFSTVAYPSQYSSNESKNDSAVLWNRTTMSTSTLLSTPFTASSLGVDDQRPLSTLAAAAVQIVEQQQQQDVLTSTRQTLPSSIDCADTKLDIQDLLDTVGLSRDDLLHKYCNQKPTPLSLSNMFKYGTSADKQQRLRNAQFLHRELPIRVAQRAVDLLTLPHGLSNAKPIRRVAQVYLNYLKQFAEYPKPTTPADEVQFTKFLQSLVLDRAAIPIAIHQGVAVWKEQQYAADKDDEFFQEMEEALYRFFTARVGLRFLTEHHVLSSPDLPNDEAMQMLRKNTLFFQQEENAEIINESNKRGCVQTDLNLIQEVGKVVDSVRQQVEDYYGICPEIELVDCTKNGRNFTYVPHHLHYMLSELLKNSCRATIRQHFLPLVRNNDATLARTSLSMLQLPPIRVILVNGNQDVTIKVADKGGGIPRSRMDRIWKFLYSTADSAETKTDFGTDSAAGAAIRGFGLPLARIYARYFGGELTLKSTEGYGLDAYLHLPRLGDEGENLPKRVLTSPGQLDSIPSKGSSRRFSTSRKQS